MRGHLYLVIALAMWVVALVLVFMYAPRTNHKRINCTQAEFHPDFTAEMKEQCRLMRSGRLL
jgi:hypothetical protein